MHIISSEGPSRTRPSWWSVEAARGLVHLLNPAAWSPWPPRSTTPFPPRQKDVDSSSSVCCFSRLTAAATVDSNAGFRPLKESGSPREHRPTREQTSPQHRSSVHPGDTHLSDFCLAPCSPSLVSFNWRQTATCGFSLGRTIHFLFPASFMPSHHASLTPVFLSWMSRLFGSPLRISPFPPTCSQETKSIHPHSRWFHLPMR